jgi:type IV pilus assembly protein PilB
VTAALNVIIAQRLARRVCSECKEEIPVDPVALRDIQVPEELIPTAKLFVGKGKGCARCNGTGFKGRVALYEVLVISDPMKECILQGYSAAELKNEAIRLGMKTLRQSAITKLVEGVTTISEVVRCSASD